MANIFDQFDTPDSPRAPVAGNVFDQFDAPPPSWSDTAKDVGQSIGTGLARGTAGVIGFPETLRDFAKWGAQKVGDPVYRAITGKEPPTPVPTDVDAYLRQPSYSDVTGAIQGVTGPFHEPTTGPGRVAETVSEFFPAALGGEGSLGRRFVQGALVPGTASQAAGEITAGQPIEPYARAAAGFGAGLAYPHIVTPNPMKANIAPAMQVLEREGIAPALTAGQRTGSKNLQRTESVLADTPLSGTSTAEINEGAAEAFTQAALRRVNIDAPRTIAPDGTNMVDQAFTNNSREFDRLTAANSLHPAEVPQILTDMNDAATGFTRLTGQQPPPALTEPIDRIQNILNAGGVVDGRQYQNLRSEMARDARNAAEPHLSHAISESTEALDDGMERSLARTGSPDAGAFPDARRIYRNLLVIERAATAGGQQTAQGIISPAQLQIANKAVLGRRAQARSQGEFSELARSGQAVMTPLPDSGTAARAGILGEVLLGGTLGGLEGGSFAHAMGGLGGGAVAQALASRLALNPVTQGYLRNQAVPRIPTRQPQWLGQPSTMGGGYWRGAPLSELYALSLADRLSPGTSPQ